MGASLALALAVAATATGAETCFLEADLFSLHLDADTLEEREPQEFPHGGRGFRMLVTFPGIVYPAGACWVGAIDPSTGAAFQTPRQYVEADLAKWQSADLNGRKLTVLEPTSVAPDPAINGGEVAQVLFSIAAPGDQRAPLFYLTGAKVRPHDAVLYYLECGGAVRLDALDEDTQQWTGIFGAMLRGLAPNGTRAKDGERCGS